MSRIRSIHPGIWTDDAFMSLSAMARLLYIGLWTEAYDDGVFEWKPLTLKARIFPADAVDMEALLAELAARDFIMRETSRTTEKSIGLIRNFREFQRPKTPNSSGMLDADWRTYVGLPPVTSEPLENHSGNDPEKGPQMEDVGGRMEEEDKTAPPVVDAEGARVDFEDVWEAFPRNPSSSLSEARAAFDRTKPADRPDILKAAIRRAKWFAQDCEARGRDVDEGERFEPHLSTWLKGKWRDSLSLPVKGEADPALTVVVKDTPDFKALEKHRGKAITIWGDGNVITVTKAELEQARAA